MKPCQDVSLAGRRAGMTEGTRSNLWGAMRTAIETIQPRYVVAENVRGLLSAKAESDSDMEPGPGFVGDDGRPNLRALGRVLGDLADLGFDAGWYGLRASDVGAPHGRFRVFILAWRRDAVPHPRGVGGYQAIQHDGGHAPAFNWATVPNQSGGDPVRAGSFRNWGPYAGAVERWERLHGPAPTPVELTGRGQHMLSPAFCEWLMGLPAGWVTDVDISRNEQLKALGNGVVPHQAYAALTHMLNTHTMESAA